MTPKDTHGNSMHVASILQSISEGLVTTDNTGIITFVNDKAEKLLSTQREYLLGKNLRDIYPEATHEHFYTQYNTARQMQQPVEYTHYYKPHNRVYVSKIYPLKDGMACYFRDATKDQPIDDELIESHRRYKSLFESMHMGVVYYNDHEEIITANPAALSMLGSTIDEVQGLTPKDKKWRVIKENGSEFVGIEHPVSTAFKTGAVVKGVIMGVFNSKKNRYFWIKVDAVPQFREGEKDPYQVYTLFEDISDLKQSRDELRLREQSFNVFAESVPHFVWASTPDGKKDYANAQFYAYTKAKKHELLEYRWISFVHPDDHSRVHKKIQKMKRSNVELEAEYRLQDRETGDYKWFLSKVRPVMDTRGKVIRWIGTVTDIDYQKRSMEHQKYLANVSKLLASNLNYQKTLQNVGELTVPDIADWCIVDMFNGESLEAVVIAHKDPKMVKLAKKFREMYPLDLHSTSGIGKVVKTKAPKLIPIITDKMLNKSITDREYLKIIKKLGFSSVIMVPIVIRNKAVGVMSFIASESRRHYSEYDLAMAENVAQRVASAIENSRVYEEAQRNEALYKALFDANIIGVVYSDFTGKVYDANEEFLRVLGYSKSDLQSGAINWELLTSEYRLKGESTGNELLESGSVNAIEIELIKKDGNKVPVIIGAVLLDKKTTETLSFVLDITERKKLDQRKDEFISIASHELKTPLTSIKGYTQILERIIQEMGDEKAKTYLSKTNDYIDRLNSLITDLLDVSKIQAGKLLFNTSTFHFKDFLHESIESMKYTANKHAILSKGNIDAIITGDRNRLEQVLNNFISNAIKYSPDADKVEVLVKQKKGYVTVAVKDSGVGIPKDELPRLFDRFYRVEETSKRFSGLGIGLYISSEIIARHGGQVWVESTLGKGSTFYFSLPIQKIH